MSWTYEVALRGEPNMLPALQAWLVGPRADYATLSDLVSFDVYTNDEKPSLDPFNHDGPGPLMLLMLEFSTLDGLRAAVSGGRIGSQMSSLPTGIAVTGAAFERLYYPVGAGTTPAPLAAPFSYVVRYHRPSEDMAKFIANYIGTHPQTQANLPDIRAITCYLPLDAVNALAGPDLPDANYMVGNEVAFDDIDAFNASMQSPVRQELRAHFREFPKFSGAVTHYPMQRVRLAG